MKLSAFFRIGLIALIFCLPASVLAQDDEDYLESLLKEEVENVNLVYKPVIGFGYGYINFYGEVKNKKQNPIMGTPAYKINVATFVDNKRYLKANFFLMLGQMGGNKTSSDSLMNLNFKTDITTFGINLHYDFKPFIKTGSLITPFVSLGIENVQFNSKSDLYYGDKIPYIYRSDGTIRSAANEIIKRDNIYESDLRDLNLYGLGSYNQSTFAVPVDVGLDFAVSNRVTMRLGYSLHYTFTDDIDNVSSKATQGIKGNKLNDMFTYSYLTFHFDLFSSPKTITIQKLFAEVDWDYSMYGDSDNDLIFDYWDNCPNTPPGVEVDTTGCPYDDDKDGVPNYQDKELHSKVNAIVDNDGIEINAEKLAEELSGRQAISRSEVESFLMMQRARTRYNIGKSSIPIPQKYKQLDKDMDGYISFDELLDAIDGFFDDSPVLKSPQDIYELNDFFFAQ
ncbi:MAG: outer membrane beta-barrel protein [Bacteroidales bacterium]|nr:outer membrane beta-barrel protein [Bacteroidales bacterium]